MPHFIFVGGASDSMLMKTDENGDTIWVKTYGGDETDVGVSLQQTPDGGYIIVGSTFSPSNDEHQDIFLVKFVGADFDD